MGFLEILPWALFGITLLALVGFSVYRRHERKWLLRELALWMRQYQLLEADYAAIDKDGLQKHVQSTTYLGTVSVAGSVNYLDPVNKPLIPE